MRKFTMLFLIVFTLLISPASAEVITTGKTEGYPDYIYVAGETDNYPIEYYDDDMKAYCGVIPDMLQKISERSGIDFVYINGNKGNKETLGENLQVDIVSSVDGITSYGKDYLELISYEKDGKLIKSGIVFTTLASDNLIASIKSAVNDISKDEINGIYFSYASQNTKTNYKWLVGAIILSLVLSVLIFALLLRIKRLRKENRADKMTDDETGMGNLQFFKHHFRFTIGDVSRNLYYIAYIILDSSYLRSYHGDSSFEEVLKYTASVLSEYTGSNEISARITENGFVFAYQSTNDEDA